MEGSGIVPRGAFLDALRCRICMKSKSIENAVSDLIGPVLEQEQIELVDVVYRSESGRWVLRILIDKPEGVNLEDCVHVSRKIGDLIEVEETVPHRFSLEVSSPGLDRPIKTEADFERFVGRQLRLRARTAQAGRRNFRGKIVRCVDGEVVVSDSQGNEFCFPLDEIQQARLEIDSTIGCDHNGPRSGRKGKGSRARTPQ